MNNIKYIEIPKFCPSCKKELIIKNNNNVKTLWCENEFCDMRLINRLDHFCSKKGLDIKGLSKATLEKLLDWGLIENIDDIYTLCDRRNEWINKPGFGEKSVDKILNAIEEGRHTTLEAVISAAGIPLVGRTVAKTLAREFKTYDDFRRASSGGCDFSYIDGFGYEMNKALQEYDYTELDEIVEKYLIIEEEAAAADKMSLEGLTIVITGKLSRKRDDIKADIESKGGKVTGSVSSKTSYLVCNQPENTSKYNKAKELGIPIITEEELYKLG